VPLPLPLLPELMVIQLAPLEALQEQPSAALTITVPVPPLEPKASLTEEME
jgi:hypothetical protein